MVLNKILIIQTAFIGDVILATGLLEKLHAEYPKAEIHFLLRKGNEGLLENHPLINQLLVWDKKIGKFKNLISIIKTIRKNKYDALINLQRFEASGLITFLSGARIKLGFDKNPFSFCYTDKAKHEIGNGKHEIERNQLVIESICSKKDESFGLPKLYPSAKNFEDTLKYKTKEYIVVAPASVWFTKQVPVNKWIELITETDSNKHVYLIGAPNDLAICEAISKQFPTNRISILAGKLNFLESAALMKDAAMNYTNDSAPLHIASAMQAKVTAVFCSTIPEFGFGPTNASGIIAQTEKELKCRPCGLHGLKECPKGHFDCAQTINMKNIAL